MTDKRELLHQLRIEREQAPQSTFVNWKYLALAWLLTAGLFWLLGRYGQPTKPQPATADATSTSLTQPPDNGSPTASKQTEKSAQHTTVLSASGYVTPRRWATVSSKVMGQLTEVLVEEGMAVRKGQILARIDDSLAQKNLAYAKAQATAAHQATLSLLARIEDAEKQLARVRQLRAQNLGSESQLSTAQATLKDLQAQLQAQKARAKAADIELQRQLVLLGHYTVRAPFDGIVTMKNAQPGEIIAPGSAGGGFTRTGICTLVDMRSLEIEVDVNESFIGRVQPGQIVQAKLDAYPDWSIPAHVIAIVPAANRAKATVRVRIGFDQLDPRILPDMGVSVSFLSDDS